MYLKYHLCDTLGTFFLSSRRDKSSPKDWILEMDDSRNQSHIIYIQADLRSMAILKNICSQYTMRQLEGKFNKENCIDTLRIMS